ncbi:MAG: hypothetical protein E7548_07080 [Ruminococcaceae bacterium]|nr:hypothetical protein [Oscillospiraceae bacterium]
MEKFTAPFIKSPAPFCAEDYAPAPAQIFLRQFNLDKKGKATLCFCPLGYGYCFINGKSVTEDLLLAPISEYDRLLWYNVYDVTHLLKDGENVIAVILGNGFFNENFPSAWDTNKMPWRDNLKFALSLQVEGEALLESDEKFLCKDSGFVAYNQLRSGETFDARLYDENWKTEIGEGFKNAVIDQKTVGVKRKECLCEPIREFEEYDFISCRQTNEGYLLDFGVNISGYLRVSVNEAEGTAIEMRHAEQANEDGSLKLNRLDIFYPTVDFQVDRYICGKKNYTWSPKFTYHGFRYVLVKGLSCAPKKGEFKAVFVHQAVRKKADFSCSNELINKIYNAGIRSTYSNLHYALTDCPTREKLGWTNDAASSFEQMYINFDIKQFMGKWAEDMVADMDENGSVSAVIPAFYNGRAFGPLCDCVIFKLPLTEFLYLKDNSLFKKFLPLMERYYTYFTSDTVDKSNWLDDWDGHESRIADTEFLFQFFKAQFAAALMLAQEQVGAIGSPKYAADLKDALSKIKENYILENGESKIDSQTVISMLLSLKVFDAKPLIEQLKRRVEKDNFHLTSGMLGLQFIYNALFENGAGDYAFRLITAEGHPSFDEWFKQDATTLWETWEDGHTDSKNHHMLSGVIASFFRGFLGIRPNEVEGGFENIELNPCFVNRLDHCEGFTDTYLGRISAAWERRGQKIAYTVCIPDGVNAVFKGHRLTPGENKFII